MRRLLSLSLGLLILAGCGEKQESSPVDILHDGDAQPPASFELFDGTHGAIEYRYPLALRYLAERLTPEKER